MTKKTITQAEVKNRAIKFVRSILNRDTPEQLNKVFELQRPSGAKIIVACNGLSLHAAEILPPFAEDEKFTDVREHPGVLKLLEQLQEPADTDDDVQPIVSHMWHDAIRIRKSIHPDAEQVLMIAPARRYEPTVVISVLFNGATWALVSPGLYDPRDPIPYLGEF